MDRSSLRDLVQETPFIPFTVTLTSGRAVAINSPEMILMGKHWDIVSYVDTEGYDAFVFIRHDHIVSIDRYDTRQSVMPDPGEGDAPAA